MRFALVIAALSLIFAPAMTRAEGALLLHAARLFDGIEFKTGVSVLIENGAIVRIDARDAFNGSRAEELDLGDATLLPGFIELHAHLIYRRVVEEVVLKHGITTLREVGGPLHSPYGGDGRLRVLTSGPIITAPGGYPISIMGARDIAIAVATEAEARQTVRNLAGGGAVIIKIALEPGGEAGAPWSGGHMMHRLGDAGHTPPMLHHSAAWPMLSENIVKAIVDEAHRHQLNVTAHIGEARGAGIALAAGVDEWAHVPCDPLPDALLKQAVMQQVTIITTMDTLSKCHGVMQNAMTFIHLGGKLLYGAEIAHPDIPWGIDAQELNYMQAAGIEPLEALRTVTSKAGDYLGIPGLGTIRPGAPADLIAVKGDPLESFKTLEYPQLVMSGGRIVVGP
ncbi:MAG: amidohydrolase family protein [Gammaproteobacteria bacterium]|nr:amidohydrolase family protein [Gammaproteobacteria bacterium]